MSRPTLRFAFSHPAHALALGLGSGLPARAPGTFGTLAAWAVWRVCDPWTAQLPIGHAAWWPLIAVVLVVGTWAADRTGRALGVADSGHVVIDEIVAFWIVLAMLPDVLAHELWVQALAFVLFRCFDVVKPPPIRWLERRCKGGVGVMIDDLMAAFYTLFVLAVLVRLRGGA
jgi:phosphatidylglycerophosphatase A